MADSNTEDSEVQDLAHVSQCSIEFSRTSKGEPSWKIKQYHDTGGEADALARIYAVDRLLSQAFVLKTKTMPELLTGETPKGWDKIEGGVAGTSEDAETRVGVKRLDFTKDNSPS